MKKISILALAFILTAGLLTACAPTMTDETTAPSTGSTAPTTTVPTTVPTVPPTTAPTVPATKPTEGTEPTETTGGVNTMDPDKQIVGKRRAMPGR